MNEVPKPTEEAMDVAALAARRRLTSHIAQALQVEGAVN
jgi:hypothetical protein